MRGKTPNKADGGVVALVDGLIERALEAGASDVHFEPTDAALRVRFRVDGILHDAETIPIELLPNVVTRLKVMAGLLSYRVDIPQEGGLTLERGRAVDARISTFPTIRGERVAVRLLPKAGRIRHLGELGLSEVLVRKLVAASADMQGLILLTGPAGSGKTTTLYALLRRLQEEMSGVSLMTVEDPVEFRLDGVAQIQVTPQGELTYARALRSLVRQDPQVLLIGEIRDTETAQIAVEAALTGHLILSTMHSGHAVEAIVRLLEMGIPGFQITSTLRLVICQRLLRTVCTVCHGKTGTLPAEMERSGCKACLGSGFRGRTACAEFAEMTADLRNAILAQADSRRLQEVTCRQPDHVALGADADRHVAAGRTTKEEMKRRVVALSEP